MPYPFYVHAVGPVYIAEKNNREVALQVVFHLDELLLVGRGVGGIGDGEGARELLFDGDPGGCVRFGGGPGAKRVHAKMADAEEFFNAAAESGGNCFGEQRGGAVVLPAGGLRAERALLPGSTQSEERNDVGIGKRRVRTIVESQTAGRAGKVYGDQILADNRGGFDVEDRVQPKRIREIEIASSERESVSAESHFSAE